MRLTLIGIGLCIALLGNAVAADNVMKVAGIFAVGKDGQATYTLPINLPSLPEEIGKTLALTYNSQGGVGIAGKGWAVAGLSAITRCDLTVAQDGISQPVTREMTNPRYCINGQRLILDQSTANSSVRVFKEEFERFSRITAKANATGILGKR